jgi:hypothetical protein
MLVMRSIDDREQDLAAKYLLLTLLLKLDVNRNEITANTLTMLDTMKTYIAMERIMSGMEHDIFGAWPPKVAQSDPDDQDDQSHGVLESLQKWLRSW